MDTNVGRNMIGVSIMTRVMAAMMEYRAIDQKDENNSNNGDKSDGSNDGAINDTTIDQKDDNNSNNGDKTDGNSDNATDNNDNELTQK